MARIPVLKQLARHIAPPAFSAQGKAREWIAFGIADALGCMVAAAQAELSEKMLAAMEDMGKTITSQPRDGLAPVYGSGLYTDRQSAAFINAANAHAFDLDDWEIPGNTHPSAVIAPAILAMATPRTTGQQIADAYLAGFETLARLGEMINTDHYDRGWHTTKSLGCIAAATAAAKLARLDADAMTHAMALAVSRAAGYTAQFGTDAKPLQAASAAETGIMTATLAKAGAAANPHIFDHPKGMANLMASLNGKRAARSLDRMKKQTALDEYGLVFKPWPGCGYTHRVMTAIVTMKDPPKPRQVEHIELHIPDSHAAILPFNVPTTRHEALFSLPFAAAMALCHGGLTIDHLKAESWKQQEIKALMRKVSIRVFTPKQPRKPPEPDRVILRLKNGNQIKQQCRYPLGAPQNPMTPEQIRHKFNQITGGLITGGQEHCHIDRWIDAESIIRFFKPLTEKGCASTKQHHAEENVLGMMR